MKNQTITTSLNFTSDVSGALAGLKQLRQEMGNLTTDQSIFGNVDKEFAKIQKSMNELQAHEPFRNTQKGGAQYNKILDNIIVSAGKISAELKEIGKNSDGSFKFQALQQAQVKLEGMLSELTRVQNKIKDTKKELGSSLKGMGMNKELANQVKTEDELVKILEIELQRRKEIYDQLVKERTQKAQDKASSAATLSSTEIQNAGSKYNTADKSGSGLTAAAKSLSSLIGKEMSEGIDKGRKFEEVWAQINKIIKDSGVTLVDIDAYQAKLSKEYQSAEVSAKKVSEKITEAEASMLQLGTRTEDGKVKLNEAAINAGKLAGEISGATNKEAELGTKIALQTGELQKQTQVESENLSKMSSGTDEINSKLQQEINHEKQLTNQLVEQTKEQDKLNKTMENMQNWITRVLSLTNGWRQFRRIVQKTFQDVQKLDKAFASIAMVTDKTVEGLWNTYGEYAEMANKLGQSTESAIKASALFYQQGLDTVDALSLTEQTMKLATLAGADFETATQQMTAALRGFHMEMDQGAHVTDVYSELAAHAAADVNGIAYAMSKTASIASSAGMDFETTAAFLTNMIETTQEAPENIGTAMKTIIARFTELKENVSAADSEFDDLDYNKVDKALKTVGINLKDANGQFRNLDDVFLELSSKWDSLDRNTQRYIATIAAGSRQQSRFIAMMEDYDRTMELVETAQNSAGRSSQQFAKYQDTVEYKLNQLKNAWEQLRVNMVDSDIFKGALESLTKFVQGISQIDFKKILPMAIILAPLIKSFITSFIQQIKGNISEFSAAGKKIGEAIKKGLQQSMSDKGEKSILDSQVKKLDKIKQHAEKLKNKIAEINQENAKIEVVKPEQEAIVSDLSMQVRHLNDEIEKTINEEGADSEKVKELTTRRNALNSQLKTETERMLALNEQTEKNNKELEKLNSQVEKTTEKEKKLEVQIEKTRQSFSKGASSISSSLQAIGTAALTAFTAIASGAKATDAIKAMVAAIALSSTQLISTLISTGATATATALGEGQSIGAALGVGMQEGFAATGVGFLIITIGLVLAEAAYGIFTLKEKADEANKSAQEQLNDAKEALEQIEQIATEKQNTAKEQIETTKNTNDMIKRYDELNHKIVKTTEEQEEWNKLISEINEQFSEIVSSYDEANNKITIQRDLWGEIAELQKESAVLSQKQATLAKAGEIGLQKRVAELDRLAKIEEVSQRYGYDKTGLNIITTDLNTAYQNAEVYLNEQGKFEKVLDWESVVKSVIERNGADISEINEAFKRQNAMTQEQWKDYFFELMNENSYGWTFIENGIDNITQAADDSYQRQIEYYDKLEEQNIASFLEAQGTTSGTAKFVATGANKYRNYDNEYYEQLQSANYDIISGFMNDVNNDATKWKNLTYKQMQIISSLGYDTEEKWEKARKNILDDDNFAAQFKESLKVYISEDMASDLSEYLAASGASEVIDNYMSNYQTMSEEEIKDAQVRLENLINKSGDKEIIKMGLESLNNLNRQILQEKTGLIEELVQETGFGNQKFTRWTIDQLKSYSELAQKAINEMGAGAGKEYLNGLDSVFSEYQIDDSKISAILNNVNWESANGANWESFRESAIESFKDLGVISAESFFDELAEYNQKYGMLTISLQDEEVTEFLDKISETVDSINGNRSDIAELSAKVSKGISIDFDEYQKYSKMIEEMGLEVEDYLNIDKNGNIIANAEKIATLFTDSYDQQLESIKEQIDNLDNELDIRMQQIELEHLSNLEEINKEQYLKDQLSTEQSLLAVEYERKALWEESKGNYAAAGSLRNRASVIKEEAITQEEIEAKREELIKKENERYEILKKSAIQSRIDAEEELTKKYNQLSKERLAAEKMYITEYTKDIEDTVEDTSDKIKDALENIAKAEQDVIDKTKELNGVLYGEEFHKNKLDPLYNYTIALNQFTKEASRAKEALENSKAGDNVQELMNSYLENSHGELVNRRAQNEVISASISNYQAILTSRLAAELSNINARHGSNISTNVSDYVYKNGNRLGVNFQALNAAKLPDSISDYVEETIETINKLQDQIDDNTDAIRKKEQELLQMRKSALERRKSLEDDVVKVLQDNAKKEVDIQKDKYDAMKTADDEYLDALEKAINKERELREKNNKWNDLATKEKKLSLMQRDTSRANAKEIMDLEQEVQNDRQQMLDDSIDEIIDNMKEMYELQQESREIELEYQEAMLDSTEWIKQATNIIEGWKTSDDMVQWFVQNATEEFTQGSEITREIMTMKWQETGDQMVADTEILGANMEDIANVTSEEITTTVIHTSETLTTEANTSLATIVASTEDAITKAQDALTAAIQSVQAARDDYTKAIQEYNDSHSGGGDNNTSPEQVQDRQQASSNAWEATERARLEEQILKDLIHGNIKGEEATKRLRDLGFDYDKLNVYYNHGLAQNQVYGYKNGEKFWYSKYASGGMVDYTGPAWVDGTPSEPEAFLSAEDTKRIGAAAELLSSLPLFNNSSIDNSVNNGDSLIEVHINIENISSDVDLDNALDRMKTAIWQAANPTGSSVILSK